MKLGVIADDFTGASDIALTLAEGGMSVTQFIGVPAETAPDDLDAGVVALKSRTAPVSEAIADSLAACDWLLAQGVTQIVLKVCSTFDSTPDGNIGPVLEALAARLDAETILVCPAFPENGRSVYQGHLFVNDMLLNESGMQNHPLTPMTDADLRRVLGAQVSWPVDHVPIKRVTNGAASVLNSIPNGKSMVIVDAIQDTDLWVIGAAAKKMKLLCGGSGIALGLPANFGATAGSRIWQPVDGPGVVMSGSCSIATRGQVKAFANSNPAKEITAEDVMSGAVSAETLADWVVAQSKTPLVYSSADPEVVKQAQGKFGTEVVASKIESLFSDLAKILVARGIKRIVVAGGETSGAVTSALSASALQVGPKIAAGVPVVRLDGGDVALALKSGNFGGKNFFSEALQRMSEPQ